MKKLVMAILAMLASLAIAGSLYAASDPEDPSEMDYQSSAMENKSADDLIGMAVHSQDGEKVGKIKKVVLDEDTGDIRFFTLSKGGILGMGGEEVAIPKDALEFDESSATLTVSVDMLENAPKQAELSNEEFTRQLETYYGAAPEWEEPGEDMNMDE